MQSFSRRFARPILTAASMLMLCNMASAGFHAMGTAISKGIQWRHSVPKAAEFSHAPGEFTAPKGVQRHPRERGGVWSKEALAADAVLQRLRREEDLMRDPGPMIASINPVVSTLIAGFQEGGGEGGSEAGIPFPTEGSFGGDGLLALAGTREAPLARTWVVQPALQGHGKSSGGGGGTTGGSSGGGTTGGIDQRNQLNPNTGNFVTYVPIVGWSARGGNYVQFSLFHNSKHPVYSFQDLGARWSHSYAMWVDYSSAHPGTATLVTGDGMRWPFTRVGTSNYFNPPAGVHGQLYKTSGSGGSKAFRLTAPDKELYFFDDDGLLVKIRDRDDNSVIITRDTDKYITTVGDETGRELEFNYIDVNGNPNLKRIASIEAPDGKVWEFTYNSTVQMTQVKYPEIDNVVPIEAFSYNSTHQILTHTDTEGDAWTYTYTGGNDKMLDTATNPLNKTWDYNYFQSSAACADPNSEVWACFYTSGRITSSADPNGFVEHYAVDAAENLTQLIDKRGKTWSWTYSYNHSDPWQRGNMLTATDPLSRATTFSYNGAGDLIEAENALGQSATVTYYASPYPWRPYQITDANSVTQATFTYNSYGEVTRVLSDQLSTKADFTFDSYGNVTQSDAVSAANDAISTTATYDILGRTLTATDAAGETKEFEYDELGRLCRMYHEDDSYVQATYDLVGRIVQARNEMGKTYLRNFNVAGYLTSTQNAEGDVQSLRMTIADNY